MRAIEEPDASCCWRVRFCLFLGHGNSNGPVQASGSSSLALSVPSARFCLLASVPCTVPMPCEPDDHSPWCIDHSQVPLLITLLCLCSKIMKPTVKGFASHAIGLSFLAADRDADADVGQPAQHRPRRFLDVLTARFAYPISSLGPTLSRRRLCNGSSRPSPATARARSAAAAGDRPRAGF